MALVQTTFTADTRRFSFSDTDAPDPAVPGYRPLGQLLMNVVDGAVPLSAAGDTQEIVCDFTLPSNFQYVLMDARAKIDGLGAVAADNWNNLGGAIYTSIVGQFASPLYEAGFEWLSQGASLNATRWDKFWRPVGELPKYQLTGGGSWTNRFDNTNAEDIAVVFNFQMWFWVYTIAQEFDALVNTPTLVR